MALGEDCGQRRGVAPAVVHVVRLLPVSSRSAVDLPVKGAMLVVSLYSGSCTLAGNLVLASLAVLEAVLATSGRVLFLSALITTPSSKEPSSRSHERDPPTSVDTVEARSSAAAGPATRSAAAAMSSSASAITVLFGETLVRAVDQSLEVIVLPERKLTGCVLVEVRPWAPAAARGPRRSSRAQSSATAAGTMGLGRVGLGGRPATGPGLLPPLPPLGSRPAGSLELRPRGRGSDARATPLPRPRPRGPQGGNPTGRRRGRRGAGEKVHFLHAELKSLIAVYYPLQTRKD